MGRDPEEQVVLGLVAWIWKRAKGGRQRPGRLRGFRMKTDQFWGSSLV